MPIFGLMTDITRDFAWALTEVLDGAKEHLTLGASWGRPAIQPETNGTA